MRNQYRWPSVARTIKDGVRKTYPNYEKGLLFFAIKPGDNVAVMDQSLHDLNIIQHKWHHSALRKQKKQHWDEFLDEPGNIWDTCCYIDDKSSQASFAPISGLKTSDTTKVTNNFEMAQVFLKEFFPPLPEYPLSTSLSPESTIHQLTMVPITEDEITKAVFSTSLLKGPGPDTIPALVWRKLWPTVKDTVSRIFTASIEYSIMPDQWKTARIIPLIKPQKEDYLFLVHIAQSCYYLPSEKY